MCRRRQRRRHPRHGGSGAGSRHRCVAVWCLGWCGNTRFAFTHLDVCLVPLLLSAWWQTSALGLISTAACPTLPPLPAAAADPPGTDAFNARYVPFKAVQEGKGMASSEQYSLDEVLYRANDGAFTRGWPAPSHCRLVHAALAGTRGLTPELELQRSRRLQLACHPASWLPRLRAR